MNYLAGHEKNAVSPLILAADTSSKEAGLALLRGQKLLATMTDRSGQPHSQTLFQNLQGLLQQANVRIESLDAFAVITGPGSFTGLRVGMAAIKGLAHTLGKPAFGVTAIDAQALAAGVSGSVLVLNEAARNEVFCGLRQIQIIDEDVTMATIGADRSSSPERVLQEILADLNGEITLTGNAIERCHELIADVMSARESVTWRIRAPQQTLAEAAAHHAARLLKSNAPASIHAYYLRPADVKPPKTHA